MDDKHVFASGAASSGLKPRYDLIPLYALERIALRFTLGAEKYGANNWKNGIDDKDFILDRLSHAVEHLYKAIERIHENDWDHKTDDDLAGVILNCIFAMEYEHEQLKEVE